MSIPEFVRSFGTEAQCADALRQARWPKGFVCPRCGTADHYVVGHGARKLFQCNGCRHQACLTSGNLMQHTKLALTTWFLAIYLISQAKTGLSVLSGFARTTRLLCLGPEKPGRIRFPRDPGRRVA